MAIYHLSMQVVSRSKGQNVVAMAAYRSGEKLVDEKTGESKKYSRLTSPDSFILAPENAPKWVYDRQKLWNETERIEKRIDSQLAREVNVALPIELSNEEQKNLVMEFVDDAFVSKGMIADVSIHRDDLNNPHFHVLLSTRDISEDGFGLKNRSWNPSFANRGKAYSFEGRGFVKNADSLVELRKKWAIHTNIYLEKANAKDRIDHRSYEERGMNHVSSQHLGRSHNIEKKARQEADLNGVEYRPITRIGRLNQEIKKLNHQVKEQESNVVSLKEAIRKKKEDVRYQLGKNGMWDNLSPSEKVAIQYVQKRMKESATLPLALDCKASIERFSVSIERKESYIEKTKVQLTEARELYKGYVKAEDRSIEKDRYQLRLARMGFTVQDFKNELTAQVNQLKAEIERIPKQKQFVHEGLEKVNQAIDTLERFTWTELQQVYKSQVEQMRYLPAEDAYRLLDQYRLTGQVVPIEKVESYLQQTKSEKSKSAPSLVELQDKYSKDNRFLVNWHRKLERMEKEALVLMKTDPKKAASDLKQISSEQQVLAERFKQLKTAMHVLDKAMNSEVQRLYPGQDVSNMDPKYTRQILRLNEVEGRTVGLDEIQQFHQPATKREYSRESYSIEAMDILDDISHSVAEFFENQKSNNIHRALEREKWKRIKGQFER